MEKDLKKAFQNLIVEPKDGLVDDVWHQIVVREKRSTRIKLYLFSSAGLLSILGFIPALKALFDGFTQSGFYEYFSLVFSSGSNLFSYWKELGLSLIESLPVLNIIFTFSLVFIFLLSIRYVIKQIINQGQLSFSI